MLSGEGNENGEKATISLIRKKSNFARAAHLFCIHFFARKQRETSRSLLHGYKFYGGNVVRRPFSPW